MKTTYFIAGGDFVKIGSSDDPDSRVAAISTACPFEVKRLTSPVNLSEKAARRIAEGLARRVNGEWFEKTPDLMVWILTGEIAERKIKPISSFAETAKSAKTRSKTVVHFDLADELTPEEIAKFEEAAAASGAENLTDHFLNLTLRVEPTKPDRAA